MNFLHFFEVRKREGKWEETGEKMVRKVPYPDTISYRIEGLHSNSNYKIELRAHNKIGYSAPAQAMIKTANGT